MNAPAPNSDVNWEQRLAVVIDTMLEMSRQTDPQEMVSAYGRRMDQLLTVDALISLSRRGLSSPQFRITRSSLWDEPINPWKQKDRLPLLSGGLLADLIYGEYPRIIDDLEFSPDDPAADYLAGHRSLVAIPMYDQGEVLNMVVFLRRDRAGFPREELPEYVWSSNLFGRATSNLVLKAELQRAYQALDRELQIVGEIQRSLLPADLPQIPTLDLAAWYQPAKRAGGDYYDFFPLPDGKWGLFIADVSGHGTPAAVLMAVTHCIAHTHPGPIMPPARVLDYLNHQLSTHYTALNETFVTAFYGVYDPARRVLNYASAGHNPPRIQSRENESLSSLGGPRGLPLGVMADCTYQDARQELAVGDQIIFYTDGITEAQNPQGELFGVERLDRILTNCDLQARALLDSVLASVEQFADGHPPDDDRTLIVARVSG